MTSICKNRPRLAFYLIDEKSFTEVTAPKSCTSANSVIPAYSISLYFYSGRGYLRRSVALESRL